MLTNITRQQRVDILREAQEQVLQAIEDTCRSNGELDETEYYINCAIANLSKLRQVELPKILVEVSDR